MLRYEQALMSTSHTFLAGKRCSLLTPDMFQNKDIEKKIGQKYGWLERLGQPKHEAGKQDRGGTHTGDTRHDCIHVAMQKKDQPTNPSAQRLPLPRASVNESCQRLWHLLSTSLVNDPCQRLLATTGVNDSLTLDNSCQRMLSATRENEHDMT